MTSTDRQAGGCCHDLSVSGAVGISSSDMAVHLQDWVHMKVWRLG
jgi:hypothetical protein